MCINHALRNRIQSVVRQATPSKELTGPITDETKNSLQVLEEVTREECYKAPVTVEKTDIHTVNPPVVSDNVVVKVKNLSSTTTEGDVMDLMSNMGGHVRRIDVVKDSMQQPTGEAFVEFSTPESAAQSIALSGRQLNDCAIEVFPTNACERHLYTTTVAQPLTHQVEASHNIIWMRGFPFNCSESDVAAFLQGLNICAHGIHIVLNMDGSATGEVLAEMKNLADYYCALSRNGMRIGHRYIEVFECCAEDLWLMPERELKNAEERVAPMFDEKRFHSDMKSRCSSECSSPKCSTPEHGSSRQSDSNEQLQLSDDEESSNTSSVRTCGISHGYVRNPYSFVGYDLIA